MTAEPAGIFTGTFWRYAGERAVKTAMQTAIASVSVDALLTGLDWQTMCALILGAAATSIATSLNSTSPGPTLPEPTVPTVLDTITRTINIAGNGAGGVNESIQRGIDRSQAEFRRRMGWDR